MRIDKLEVGLTFKNYYDMCNTLEIPIKSGKGSRNAQFKHLCQYCRIEKNGHQIKVVEIYKEPIPKIDNRGKSLGSRNGNKFRIPLYITNPKLAAQWLEEENGMKLPDDVTRTITEEFWWKCSDCEHKIYSSPTKRFNKSKGYKDEFITCPYCSLSKGAKVIYDYLEYHDISFKMEYMYDDLLGLGGKKLRFDFALFNHEDILITLIEFDGGYHDEELNPDIEKHKILSSHDILKDTYCATNKIPLLRIHHSEMDDIEIIVANYLTSSSLNVSVSLKDTMVKDYNKKLLNIINKYENMKKSKQIELLKIDEMINEFKSMVI